MTFAQFTAFVAVAKHLNVTRAANTLHISQPSLSKHIKNLEENLRLTLFTRHPKGIKLTDEGYEFLRDIKPILAHLDKINRRYLNHSAKKTNSSLKVGGTYGPASRILPSLLTEFKNKHPKVDINLRANSGGIIHQKILHGDLEIAVCSSAPAPASLLYSESYIAMKFVAIAAKNDPIARRKELTLAELKNLPIIVRNHGGFNSVTQTLLRKLKEPGQKLNIAMACESPEAIERAVSQRLGIGFLYYDAVREAIERGSFKIINIRGLELLGQTYIIYHKERPLSPNAEEFLELLREWRDQQNTSA